MHARTQPQARPLRLGSAEVYTGTCSWTRGFEQWYRPHLRTTSAGRLAHYASRFPAAEVDSTYYALPRPGQTVLLARRTPQGFLFGVKTFGPLTGHPTDPARLPEPARLALPPELRSAERLWPRDLPRARGRWNPPGAGAAAAAPREPRSTPFSAPPRPSVHLHAGPAAPGRRFCQRAVTQPVGRRSPAGPPGCAACGIAPHWRAGGPPEPGRSMPLPLRRDVHAGLAGPAATAQGRDG
jgi:hypothetical protein